LTLTVYLPTIPDPVSSVFAQGAFERFAKRKGGPQGLARIPGNVGDMSRLECLAFQADIKTPKGNLNKDPLILQVVYWERGGASMEASSIRAYEIFRKRFSSEEAETIMAWKDESLSKWVAGKEDLARVEISLREDLAGVKEELRGDIAALDTKITSVRTELKEDIASVRTELKEDIASVRTELKEDIAGIREDMSRLEVRLITWFVATSLAMTGIVLTILKFFF